MTVSAALVVSFMRKAERAIDEALLLLSAGRVVEQAAAFVAAVAALISGLKR